MSWRTKGGVAKSDSINNINVNTIVADTLTLKDYYYGNFEILGNIRASGSIEIESNLIANYVGAETLLANTSLKVLKSATIYGNAAVKRDMYLFDRVVMGNIEKNNNILTLMRNDNFGNFFIDQAKINDVYQGIATEYYTGKFGVNNPDPVAAIDVFSGLQKVLDVKSNDDINYNILARNVNNTGVVLYTDNETASVRFFNETEIDGVDPDAILEYSQGGDLHIDTSNNTFIHSTLSLTNRDQDEHIMDELVVIYDPSDSEPLMYDIYENEDVKGGQALSLVAHDMSSTTIMNIITPDKKGMAFIGGSYPYEPEKSMGIIGTINPEGKYEPSIGITSTDNHLYFKNTVSINTTQPKLGDRALDINGKVFIRNSQLTLTTRADFEILNYAVCKKNRNYSIALGSPYTLEGDPDTLTDDPNVFKNYQQKILYSSDSCKTWNESNFNNTDIGLVYNVFKGIYLVDEQLAFVGANYGVVYFTNNGGETWFSISNVPYELNIHSIHVISLQDETENMRVILVGPTSLYWFDISQEIYTLSEGINSLDIDYGTVDFINFISSKASGSTDYLYVIGQTDTTPAYYVINKYLATDLDPVPEISYETTNRNKYNAIDVYDNDTVIAVGDNMITYTFSGGLGGDENDGWFDLIYDIDTKEYPYLQNSILNNINIYDLSNAIAIGYSEGETLILYTNNGGYKDWNILSSNALVDAGAPESILSSTNISNIFITDLENIQFTNVIDNYDFDNNIYGSSSVFNLYNPTIFNEEFNFILNVSGGVMIQGNAEITNDLLVKNIATTHDLLVTGEALIETLTITGNIFADDLTLTGNTMFPNLTATGSIIGNDLSIADSAIIGGLYVLNSASMSEVSVSGNTTTANLSVTNIMTSNKTITNDLSAGTIISSFGITSKIIDVTQKATLKFMDASNTNVDVLTNTENLNVRTQADVSNINVSQYAWINRLYGYDVSINRLYTEADTSLNRLKVYNHSELENVTVNQLTKANNINATGHTRLHTLEILDDTVFNDAYGNDIYNQNIQTDKLIQTTSLKVLTDASLSNVFVSNDTSLNRLYAKGISNLSDTYINGNTQISNDLSVTQKTTLNTLRVNGQSTVTDISANNIKIYANATIDQNALIGNVNVSGKTDLHNTDIDGTLNVTNTNNSNLINTLDFKSTGLSEMNSAIVHNDASANYMFMKKADVIDLYVKKYAYIQDLLAYNNITTNTLDVYLNSILHETKIIGNIEITKKTKTNSLYVDICSNTLDLHVTNDAFIKEASIYGNAIVSNLSATNANIDNGFIDNASATNLVVTDTVNTNDINVTNDAYIWHDLITLGNSSSTNALIENKLITSKFIAETDASINQLFVTNKIRTTEIQSNDMSANKFVVNDASASTMFINDACMNMLYVNRDARIRGKMVIDTDTSTNRLFVSDLMTSKNIDVSNSLLNAIKVKDSAIFDISINAFGVITNNIIAKDISFNNALLNDASIKSNLTVGNTIDVTKDINISNNAHVANILISKDVSFNGISKIANATITSANIDSLKVLGKAYFDMSINSLSLYTPYISTSNIDATSNVIANNITANTLIQTKDLNVSGNQVITGNITAQNITATDSIYSNKIYSTDISGVDLIISNKIRAPFIDSSAIIVNSLDAFGDITGNNLVIDEAIGTTNIYLQGDAFLSDVHILGNTQIFGNGSINDIDIHYANIASQDTTLANITTLNATTVSFTQANISNNMNIKDINVSGNAYVGNFFYPYRFIAGNLDIDNDVSANRLFVKGNTRLKDVDISGNILLSDDMHAKNLVLSGNMQSANVSATNATLNAITTSSLSTTTLAATTGTITTINSGNISATGNVNIGGNASITGNISGNHLSLTGNISANTLNARYISLQNGMISGGDASFGNVFIAGTLRYTSIVSSETTLQGNTDVSNINIVGNTNLFNLNTTGNASFNNITTYGPNRFNGFTIFTSDVSINGIYRNFGNVFLQNNLNVLGDSSFNGNISNYGSTNLYGTSIMYTDASVNRILYANQIRSQTTNQTVNFMCDTSFNNMSVYGNISAFNNATIKDISLNGNFVSNGTSLLRGKFDVVGDSSLNMLNVHGTSVFNQLLIGAQDVSLNRNLSVFGNTNITNSLNVMGDGSFNNMLIRQNAAINNNLTVLGDASFITLNTSMPAKLNSVEVWNDASFNGNLKLADALYIGQNYYQFKNSSQRLLFPPLNLTSQALNSYITVSFWAYLGTKYTIDSNSILLLNDNKFLETRLNGTWYLSNTSSPQQTYTFDTGIFNLHTFVIPISTSGNISTSSFKAYLNGSILYTFTPTIAFIFNTSNNVFSFGNIPANFINNDLRVRDFRVYRGELTAQNIASLRNGTYNDTTNLIYIDTRLPFNNLKTYAYTNLYVSSDAQINQNLNVLGDASMNGNVSINTLQSNMIILSGDASLNGQVRMSGNLINNGGIFTTGDISGNTLSISNNARIMGNLFSNSLLATTGDASFNRLLNVGGNTVLNQRLLVLGDVSMNNANILGNSSIRSLKTTVFNSDDASFNKDVQIFGNTQISRSLIGHGDSSLNTLFVSGGSQHNSGMIVNKDASFNNNLSVSGLSRFNNVRVVGDASLTNLFVDGTAYFKNISVQASANGDASFNGTLSVRDEAYLNKSLTVATDTSTNTLFVSGFTRVLGGLSIGRDASFNSNMYIDGNTNIKSRLTIQGDSSANTLFVSGPSVHNSTLYVNRDASFNSNLLVRGNAIYGQKMDIYGDTSLNNLIVNGQIQLSQGLVASRDVSFNAGLAVGGNTNIGNNLSLGGDASFNKTLLTGGNTRIGGNAVIVGDSSFNGQLIIGGNTLLKQKLNVLEDATLSRNVVIGDNNMYCSYNSGTSTIQFTSLSLTSPTYTLNSYITISFWVYISSAWGPTDSDAATLLRVNGTTNFILWSTSKWIFANTLNSFTIPRGRYSLITIVYPLSDSGSVSSNSTFLYINDVLTGTYTLPNKYVTNVASTFNIGPFGNAVNASNIFVKDFRVFNYRLTYTDIYNLYNNTYTSTASAGLLQHYPLTSINSNQAITSTKNMVSNAFDGTLTSIIHKYIYSTSTEVVSDMIVRGNINTTANMITGGDLQISGNTSLYATNIQSSLIVSNDSSFNSNVYVQRNTRIDGNLRLFGDASMNGSLLIRGNAANSAIWATGDVSLNGLLTTTSNARILRQLYVGNDINTDGSMIIIGNGQINRNMAIYGDASINSILYVRGQSILQNRLTLTDDASFNKNTFILGNSRIFGRLDISQNIIVDGSLNLAGNANIMNNLFVNTDISANRNINIGGNTRILGNGIIHGDVSFNQNLNLGGNSVLRGTLTTVGDVSFNKTLSVYGNTYFDKMIIVNGDLSLNGIFKQAGTVGYDSISITNNMTVGRDATINGNAILNGNVDLSGNANFRSNLNVVNNTITRGSIFVWNDLSLNGNANVFGNINLNRRLFVSGDSSFNAAIFTGDVSLNRTLYVNGVSTIAGNNDVRGNINVENDVRIKGNIVTENNTVLKGNTNIDKYLTVALDSSMNNLTVSNNARIGNSIIASGNIISMVDISSNGNLYVKGNTNIVGNLVIGNAITTTDLSVTGSLLLKGQNIFTTENNWSGKNNFMDISLNNLTIVGNIRSPVTIDNYQDISGGVLTESLGTVDAANTRNIYTRYGPNGSTAKWSYLRQIETGNKYKLAWDFHNDNSCNMVFRSMNSLNNPDATPLTRFEINNGSIGLNGANVNHGNGGLFFDESIQNRKIILSQGANNNDYQFFGVGLQPSTMQFMSPNIDASFTFSYATSNNAKTDSAVISNKGVDIKTGSLLLAGTDLFARNNNWSGTNTFSNSILSNTSGTNKTITTTQLGYLSDLSMSFLDAFNTRPVYNQLIGQTNTWTGNNTFSNNLQLNKSLGVGSGAVIQDNSGIYFSNDSIHRKIVLQSSLAGTGNEFQNYSIGVKSNTTQFLVPNIDASYTFSYATTNNAKTDCVIISNNGLDIKRGNLLLDGSNILQRNNTWTGINTFTGNISANSQTVTPTQISYLSGVTSNIQTQINSKNSSSETLTALNVNNTTISGANSWSSQNIFNGLLKLTGNLNVNSVDVTPTQLGYLSGVTSSIQTQIDGKTTLTAIQANNNTWSGTNTFNNNNVQINKSLGIGTNALIQDNSGVYFSNDFINRKIVLYTFNYLISNECQNYSIGVQPNTTQFLVPNIDASFTFSYGTAANTKIDCVIISNNGLDIKRGNLLLDGSNILQRNNTWSGINTFSGNLSVNSQTVTPTQIGYLSGVTSSIQTQIDGKTTLAAIQANNNTWSGTNTFNNNNVQMNKSLGIGSGAVIQDNSGIYFSNDSINRKIVLQSSLTGTGNEFQNYSIGVKSNTTQFLVPNMSGSYTFSYATSSTAKTDCVIISDNGLDLKRGGLMIDGSNIFHRINSWYGWNFYNGNFQFNGITVTSTQLSYVSGVTSNIQTQLDGKTTLAAIQANNNTWTGTNTFSGNLSVNLTTVTPTQISYLSGVTSNIQTQLDSKVSIATMLANNNTWTGTNTFNSNHVMVSKSIGIGTVTPYSDNAIYFSSAIFRNRLIVLSQSVNNDFQFYGMGIQSDTFQLMVAGTSAGYLFSAATGASSKMDYVKIDSSGLDVKNGNLMLGGTNILERNNTWSGTNTFNNNHVTVSKSIRVGTAPTPDVDGAIYFPNTITNRKIVLWPNGNNEFQIYSIGIQSGTMQFMVADTTAGFTFSGGLTSLTKMDYVRIDALGLDVKTGNLMLDGSNILQRNNAWTGYNNFNSLKLNGGASEISSGFATGNNQANTYIAFAPNGADTDWCNLRQIGGNNQMKLAWDFWDDSDECRMVFRSNGNTKFEIDNGAIGLNGATIGHRDGGIFLPSTSTNRKIVFNSTANNDYQFNGIGVQNPSGTAYNSVYYVPNTSSKHSFMCGTGSSSDVERFFISDIGVSTSTNFTVTSGDINISTGALKLGGTNILDRTNTWTGKNIFGCVQLDAGTSPYRSETNTYIAFGYAGTNNDYCNLRQIGGDNQMKLAWDFWDDGDECRMVYRSNGNTKFEIDNGSIGLNGATIRHTSGGIFFDNALISRKIVLWSNANNDYQFNGIGLQTATFLFNVNHSGDKYRFTSSNAAATGFTDFAEINLSGITSASFRATSDRRLKNDLQPLESQLNKIKKLTPYHFTWKESQKQDFGFIAQEVFQTYPNMNSTDYTEDEPIDASGNPVYYSMDYGKLTTCLWKGLQETLQIVDTQHSTISILEQKVDEQQHTINTQQQTINKQQEDIETMKKQIAFLIQKIQ